MQFPKVHSNGSSPEKMIEGFLDAGSLLNEVIERVTNNCGPHARDYYVQSTEAMQQASKEHSERLQLLIRVRSELLTLAHNVRAQVDEIEARRKEYRERITNGAI